VALNRVKCLRAGGWKSRFSTVAGVGASWRGRCFGRGSEAANRARRIRLAATVLLGVEIGSGGGSLILLKEGIESVPTQDQVVHDWDAKKVARLAKPPGDG
jgi:hypothetical protein